MNHRYGDEESNVAPHELKELLERLQSRLTQPSEGATVAEVAEAAGCDAQEVLQELTMMRAAQQAPALPVQQSSAVGLWQAVTGHGHGVTAHQRRVCAIAYVFVAVFVVLGFLIAMIMEPTRRVVVTPNDDVVATIAAPKLSPDFSSSVSDNVPRGSVRKEICASSGEVATVYCPETVTQTFKKGREPKKRCTLHGPQ